MARDIIPGTTRITVNEPFQGHYSLLQFYDAPEPADGIRRDATYGYIRLLEFDQIQLTTENATLSLDPPLVLIDFVPVVGEPTLWRIRLYGGVSGKSYTGLLTVMGYAPVPVTLTVRRAIGRPTMSNIFIVFPGLPPMVGGYPLDNPNGEIILAGLVNGEMVDIEYRVLV